MPIQLRILLVAGALVALGTVCQKIRKRKILMSDAISWVVTSVIVVIVAIFPGIAVFLSNLFGIGSPSNFVFLLAIAILLLKVFSNSAEISILKHRVEELAQELALERAENGTQSDGENPAKGL